LTAKGRGKIAQKLGEEAVETVIAAMAGDRAEIIGEASDLMFHLAVLLADAGLSFDDIRTELTRREGVSGLTEKAGRKV
jgi:phosphoribosyl-ATP pyrophosphohydrolase